MKKMRSVFLGFIVWMIISSPVWAGPPGASFFASGWSDVVWWIRFWLNIAAEIPIIM
ncbi:MAG: hypothetical protein AB1746_10975 [Candidatus Zixiibacteriota bacterium]